MKIINYLTIILFLSLIIVFQKNMKVIKLAFFILTFNFNSQSQTKNVIVKDGNDVIKAMYNAYSGGGWYKNFTFSQETHFIKDGKEDKMEVWHEAATFPGKLLIKFNTKDSKNGILFSNKKVNAYSEGKEPFSKPMIHDLLLAAFDVYFLKPSESTRLFDSLGYNLKIVREDVFGGRKVYVVGAEKNDSTSNQFWIDSERFYLHKMIYKQGANLRDVAFDDYQKMKNYWVAKTVIFKQNGKLNMIENYYDIKFPKELAPELFIPEKFNDVKLD
jgi:hypothetical protein